MTGFDAYDNAVEIARLMREIVKLIRPHDKDLAEEGRTATQSIGLNVAEARRRRGGDRLHAFRIALGSAGETRAVLDQAEAWGYLAPEKTVEVRGRIDKEVAML